MKNEILMIHPKNEVAKIGIIRQLEVIKNHNYC